MHQLTSKRPLALDVYVCVRQSKMKQNFLRAFQLSLIRSELPATRPSSLRPLDNLSQFKQCKRWEGDMHCMYAVQTAHRGRSELCYIVPWTYITLERDLFLRLAPSRIDQSRANYWKDSVSWIPHCWKVITRWTSIFMRSQAFLAITLVFTARYCDSKSRE